MLLAQFPWLKFLGVDSGEIPEDAEIHFEFANVPESWGVFVFIGIAILMGWATFALYRRELNSCPRWAKHMLAAIRVLALLTLLWIFLDPSVTYTKTRSLRPVLAVLRDASKSMDTADEYRDDQSAKAAGRLTGKTPEQLRTDKAKRVDLVNTAFAQNDRKLVKGLSRLGRLRVLDFGDRVVEADRKIEEEKIGGDSAAKVPSSETPEAPAVASLPPLLATGNATDLSRALREGLSEKLTSAVVVWTDGQHNAASSMDAALAEARRRGTPVFFVGVGDAARPKNLRIADLYADPSVWMEDPFEIQAKLDFRGVDQETVQVELVELTASEDAEEPAQEKVIETKEIAVSEGDGQERISFQHTPEQPGLKFFTVRATPLDGEFDVEDNKPSSPIQVKVLDNKARVLLIAGSPTWEYRAATRLLMRENTIDLTCWLQTLEQGRQQQGNTPITELPATKKDLYDYDVIIMIDPNPADFDENWIELLKRFVRENAGGLLHMPGSLYGSQFLTLPQTLGMQDLLPVELGDVGGAEVNQLLEVYNKMWPLDVVAANVDQPIMRFYPDIDQTLLQWRELPGVYWSFPAVAPKPAARVLIEHSDPNLRRREVARPLMVMGQYGSGRTLYVGFTGTWRWRTGGYDAEFYKRFWVQSTRYLIEGRAMAGKRRGVIESEKSRYEVGDKVRLTARLREADYEPLEKEQVKGTIEIPGEDPVEITFQKIENQPGAFETSVAVSKPAAHVVKISLPTEDGEILIDTNFAVALPYKELRDTWLDRPSLMEYAAASGGKYFDIHQIDELIAAVPDRVRRLELRSKPIALWDTTRVLLFLVVLLAIEWVMRKKYRLL